MLLPYMDTTFFIRLEGEKTNENENRYKNGCCINATLYNCIKVCLLHATETSGQLHDGSQRVTSGHGGGQVGYEKTFQNI